MIPLQASVTCIQNTLWVNLKNTTKEEISAVSIDLEEQYDKIYRYYDYQSRALPAELLCKW